MILEYEHRRYSLAIKWKLWHEREIKWQNMLGDIDARSLARLLALYAKEHARGMTYLHPQALNNVSNNAASL